MWQAERHAAIHLCGFPLSLPADLGKDGAMTTALYSGSFDPPTLGHVGIIRRGAALFDRLVVAVGAHHAKAGLFPVSERIGMLAEIAAGIAPGRIDVVSFDGLVVEAARKAGATAILRGIRSGSDLDYERQMAGSNAALVPEIDTVFLVADGAVSHIASSLVRQIATLGGDLAPFVPPQVALRLKARLAAS